MNIAVFADLHGRLLLAFKLCARWQKENGERIDLILQAGDLGVYPTMNDLDHATRRYAEYDPTELGFMHDFTHYNPAIAEILNETVCPMIFVRGNHEDHAWLDSQESKTPESLPLFPIDAYRRVFLLKTGLDHTFTSDGEDLHLLGIGRISPSKAETERQMGKYIQPYESQHIYDRPNRSVDVLLTHHSRTDFVILERGVKIKASTGMQEIEYILDQARPTYHFFGHYGGPPQVRTDLNGITLSVKLADLHWVYGTATLEAGSMGLLRWHGSQDHSFEVLNAPWLKEYSRSTWLDR